MNIALFTGNLTTDINLEKGTGRDGKVWTRGRVQIAVDNGVNHATGERDVLFIPLTMWNGLAENMAKLCQKGSRVSVQCSVDYRNNKNADGTYTQYYSNIVEKFEVLNRNTAPKPQATQAPMAQPTAAPAPAYQTPVPAAPVAPVAPVAPAPIQPAAAVADVYNGPGYEAPSTEPVAIQPVNGDTPVYW